MPGRFETLGAEIGALTDDKNAAYGDSLRKCADILRIIYPNGIGPADYLDAGIMIRILDKFSRIANDKGAFSENPWRDCVGYCVLATDAGEK
jgi:hypothetical protein